MAGITELIKKNSHKFSSAVVVAAGSSTRMGQDKLMLELGGVPVLIRSLQAIASSDEVDEIVLVSRESELEHFAQLCHEYGITKVSKVVAGGATRLESALAGVSNVSRSAKIICIHDGARPLVSKEVVSRTLREAYRSIAAAPAVKIKDTVRIMKNGEVTATPDRDSLFAVQTPQAFDADIIKGALTAAIAGGLECTDDCAAVEAMGVKVKLVEGSEENIKITTPIDIVVAEAILSGRERRQK